MSVLDAIKERYSVRHYQKKAVSESDLNTVLEAARLSQSAKNLQDWRFIIVRNATMRNDLMKAAKGQSFVGAAPVIIVCCGIDTNYMMTCGQYSYTVDVAIAMENMSLVAHEIGLGTCWLGAFWEDQVKHILGIPDDVRVVGMLTLGYPSGSNPGKRRQSMETIVKYEIWE